MNNMVQMMNIIKGAKNPQEAVLGLLNNNSNPMLKNLTEMAKKGDKEGIENFARKVLKEQGRNFDTEFNEFMKNFK